MLDLSNLPRFDEISTKTANAIATLPPGWPIEIGHETTGPIRLEVANPGTFQADDIDIIASSTLGEFRLRFPNRLLDKLSDVCLPDWQDEISDGFFFKCRLIYLLHQLIKPTPLAPFDWTFLPREPSDCTVPLSLWFQMTIEGEVFPAALSIITCDLMCVQKIAPQRTVLKRRLDVAVATRVFLPSMSLPISDMQQIAPGDALILPGQHPGDLATTLEIAGVIRWRCQLSKSATTCLSIISLEETMNNPNSQTDDEFAPADDAAVGIAEDVTDNFAEQGMHGTTDLSGIRVQIDFCLTSRTVPLSTLESLEPGVTFDFDVDLAAPIIISANGQPLGKGRLIQIGERIGVRIERWAMPADRSDA